MENTEGNGGPQADDGGEREVIHTLFINSGAHQATQVLHTLSIKRGVHQAEASFGNYT